MSKLLLSLWYLLETPDISGSLYCKHGRGCRNTEATELFKRNRGRFEETARRWTKMHAVPKHSGNNSESLLTPRADGGAFGSTGEAMASEQEWEIDPDLALALALSLDVSENSGPSAAVRMPAQGMDERKAWFLTEAGRQSRRARDATRSRVEMEVGIVMGGLLESLEAAGRDTLVAVQVAQEDAVVGFTSLLREEGGVGSSDANYVMGAALDHLEARLSALLAARDERHEEAGRIGREALHAVVRGVVARASFEAEEVRRSLSAEAWLGASAGTQAELWEGSADVFQGLREEDDVFYVSLWSESEMLLDDGVAGALRDKLELVELLGGCEATLQLALQNHLDGRVD
jgi:hypothetical protein